LQSQRCFHLQHVLSLLPMAEQTVRVIIAGSRKLEVTRLVVATIGHLMRGCHVAGKRLIIVHGGCPTGADRAAKLEVETLKRAGYDIEHEEHPYESQYGKAGGPIRNQRMAKLGAALCVVFWDGFSPGTLDMMKEAITHGIPVIAPPTSQG